MSTIRTPDGVDLFVKDWGPNDQGGGPALVFTHSASTTNEIWHYQHAHFVEAGYRVIAYDRRGHGRSAQPSGGYDADTLADDLAHVLHATGVEGATLIGHSMGCIEILRYLSRHGAGRIARAVLVATTTPCLQKRADNPDGVDAAAFDALRAGWRRDYPRWVAENARPFFAPETSQALVQWGIDHICRIPVHIAIACSHVVAETDVRADCRAIAVPTLERNPITLDRSLLL
jgi:non-heme chloroperoxidase